MKIVSWNVNSIRQRQEHLEKLIGAHSPDIICLQELKCQDEAFPRSQFETLGYNIAIYGQKTFNGVAILSKFPFDEIVKGLPGDENDDQSRYIEVVISLPNKSLRIASIYLPNGNPVGTEKFPYKLDWMDRLYAHAQGLLALEEPLVLAGDYNIIPQDGDVYDPQKWLGDALFQPESRGKYRKLLNLGLINAFDVMDGRDHQYTFWDYQAGAWPKNHGIRIDHILISPQAADCLNNCWIDKETRSWEKPSDHVPIWAEFD